MRGLVAVRPYLMRPISQLGRQALLFLSLLNTLIERSFSRLQNVKLPPPSIATFNINRITVWSY